MNWEKRWNRVFLVVAIIVLGMTSLYTIMLNAREGEVEEARAEDSSQSAHASLRDKPVSPVGAEERTPLSNPTDSPASQVADETSLASTGRLLEADGADTPVEFRPFSKAEMFEQKRRELLETGQYEKLDRFEAKLSYEDKRKNLNKRKREQLRELDSEKRELAWQLAETNDPWLKDALRAPLRELRTQRQDAQYAFELEARQAREEFRKIDQP